jgi:hypothetical protein
LTTMRRKFFKLGRAMDETFAAELKTTRSQRYR